MRLLHEELEEAVAVGERGQHLADVYECLVAFEQLGHGVEARVDRVGVGRRLDQVGAEDARARRRLALVEHAEERRLRVSGAPVAQQLEVVDGRRVEEHHALGGVVVEEGVVEELVAVIVAVAARHTCTDE